MIRVITDNPIATTSPDHLHPHGTAHDNSVNLRFNEKVLGFMPMPKVLDLGCAGGGMVKSFLDMGVDAVGIEGSDFSKIANRAEWETIPDRLFTADITKDFSITENDRPMMFDFITLWEVIEHIAEYDLPMLLLNIDRHLQVGGLIVMSVGTMPDRIDGVDLHQTVKTEEWWMALFAKYGWRNRPDIVKYFGPDMVRGPGNAAGSFHVVLERA